MAVKKVVVESRMTDSFKIESQIRDHKMIIDQVKAGGGNDEGPSPLEYQLLALAGCIGTIGRIIAMQRKIALRSMDIKVEGDLDTDVLLGRRDDIRAGFNGFNIVVDIDADMTKEEKEKFLHEVDLRCPISDVLLHDTPITFEVK